MIKGGSSCGDQRKSSTEPNACERYPVRLRLRASNPCIQTELGRETIAGELCHQNKKLRDSISTISTTLSG